MAKKEERKTIEQVVSAFCKAWIKQDWDEVLKHTQPTWLKLHEEDTLEKLTGLLEARLLLSFTIVGTRKIEGPTLPLDTVVDVVLEVTRQGRKVEDPQGAAPEYRPEKSRVLLRVACETEAYTPTVDGEWKVAPNSLRTEFS